MAAERMKFRRCLIKIANRLTNQDFEYLKFVCDDSVPVARMERVRSALDLFQALEERGKMALYDLGYLSNILGSVNRANLLDELTNEGIDVPVPEGTGARPDFLFRVCLLRIAQGLSSEDVNSLRFLWSDAYLGISADKVYSATQLFQLLERRRFLTCDDPRKLYDELHEIGRSDLCHHINNYLRMLKRPAYDVAISDERPCGPGGIQAREGGPHNFRAVPHQETRADTLALLNPPPHSGAMNAGGLQTRPNLPPQSSNPSTYPQTDPYNPLNPHGYDPCGPSALPPLDPGDPSIAQERSYQCTEECETEPLFSWNLSDQTLSSLGSSQLLSGNTMSLEDTPTPSVVVPPTPSEFSPIQSAAALDRLPGSESGVGQTSPHRLGLANGQLQPWAFPVQRPTQPPGGANLEDPAEPIVANPTPSPVGERACYLPSHQPSHQSVNLGSPVGTNESRAEMEHQQVALIAELASQETLLREREEETARLFAQLQEAQERSQALMDEKAGATGAYVTSIRELEDMLKIKNVEVDQLRREVHMGRGPGQLNPDEFYTMTRIPHGICLIINNYKFHHPTDPEAAHNDRTGAQIDQYNLEQTFRYLRYRVEICENLTSVDMTDKMLEMSRRDHSKFDSFVCCILTHGENNVVHGSDSLPVDLFDLTGLVKYSRGLIEKPKLFFVQACRGDREDQGIEIERDAGGDRRDAGGDRRPLITSTIPKEADFFFGYATPPGSAAYRSRRHGSWYISELCKVLTDQAYVSSLTTMMKKVNGFVSNAFTKEGHKQCSEYVDRLRKEVHFFHFIRERVSRRVPVTQQH